MADKRVARQIGVVAAALAAAVMVSAVAVSSPASAVPYQYVDLPRIPTVAHGVACGGVVGGLAIVADVFPGRVQVTTNGQFFGLSDAPGRSCWSMVRLGWRNLETGAKGHVDSRVSGTFVSPIGGVGSADLSTGSGRVVLTVGTDLPHQSGQIMVRVA